MFDFLKGRILIVRLLLFAAVLSLTAIGILIIYSVGHPAEDSVTQSDDLEGFWRKQAVFAFLGVLVFIAANKINYRKLGQMSYWIFGAVLVLLVILIIGKFIELPFVPLKNGTRRWISISIGGINLPQIQPSELCKLAYVLALSWYLRYKSNYRRFTALIGPFALTLLPIVLILLEPDLGTVMLMMPILFVMLFVAGARVKHLLSIILMAVLVSPVLWHFMQGYQKIRISSVILQSEWMQDKAEKNEWLGNLLVGEPFSRKKWRNDWGYHLIRSKYAIASGGASGNGYRRGPFVKYDFLPERHNDFIFAVIAHQWGFWGCMGLLALYGIIIWCGLEIAFHNIDPFGKLLATGIVVMFAVEVLVNICMTVGLMPITGLTLPFVSYGGSSLLVSMASVGLLNNVGRNRHFTVAPKSFE